MKDASKGDLLYGMSAIAAYLGVAKRQAQYLKEKDRIPYFYIDSTVCSRRSTLSEWLAEQEGKARSE